ncbi:MAG: hypothetical protein KA419_14120 [Acidobacteria bacterium]|nr:hypothetical protein [Acidobacteriota bacterium]
MFRKTPGVLFVSGSIGLGHVTRDLALAAALREKVPGVRLAWLAGDAARDFLAAAGEPLLPESAHYTTGTGIVEAAGRGFSLNLAQPSYLFRNPCNLLRLFRFYKDLRLNVSLFRQAAATRDFRLVVGDETFELALAITRNPALKAAPFVLLTDFLGVDAMTRNPFERLLVRVMNRGWVALLRGIGRTCDRVLFVGEAEDVPDVPFGRRLPSRRTLALEKVDFVGYVLGFNPAALADRAAVRRRLGYGEGPVVLCAVGGTSVGIPLLRLFAEACPLVRERVPEAAFIAVGGPRIPGSAVDGPPGLDVRGYVPELYEHLAAVDLAVVQAGGATTLELTALRRPFLYFPLEGHFEQANVVHGRLSRHGAGRRLDFGRTDARSLAAAILETLGTTPGWPPIRCDGAKKAAGILAAYLDHPPG